MRLSECLSSREGDIQKLTRGDSHIDELLARVVINRCVRVVSTVRLGDERASVNVGDAGTLPRAGDKVDGRADATWMCRPGQSRDIA